MLKIIISIITTISLCLLIILLNVTAPASVGPFGILAVLVCFYLLSLGLITFFLYEIGRLVHSMSILFIAKKPIERLSFKQSYYYSTIIAVAPVMLVGLQSVGAFGVYGGFLVLIFIFVGCLYISKRIR
ncbi:MAG: hypothetical protein PWQ10_91 [Patescibacteria group bacterium]|nr:hypothetical protein [Patescibacteria group bacterium]